MAAEAAQNPAAPTRLAKPGSEDIKTAAGIITRATVGSELELKLTVGEIGMRLCGGLEAWKDYSPRDKEILEELSQEIAALDCHEWSYLKLYNAVRLFEQQSHLGSLQRQWPGVAFSYFRQVFGLPWEVQRNLLNETCRNGWGLDQLIKEATRLRLNGAEPSKPRKTSNAVRMLRRSSNALDDHDELALALAEAGVEAEKIAEIVQLMTTLDSKIDALREQLSSRKIK